MVCLIHQNQFEILWAELHPPIPGSKAPDRGNRNVGSTRSMRISHLDVDSLARVSIGAMPSCLLDKLPTMDEYECSCGIGIGRFDPINKLCEDDLALAKYTMSTILGSDSAHSFTATRC